MDLKLVISVLIIPGLLACGSYKRPSSGSEKVAHQAKDLGLKVVSGPGAASVPGPSGEHAVVLTIADATLSSQEISFNRVIQIADPKPRPLQEPVGAKGKAFYFVWDETALGSPMVSASYTHRFVTSQNNPLGNPDRVNASFDPTSRQWFIPISSLAKGWESHMDPAELQVLDLDLLLADQTRVELKVYFRVASPLPELPLVSESAGVPGSVEEIARLPSTSGFVVHREKILNPSHRAFKVWLKPGESMSFGLMTMLENRFFKPPFNRRPDGPYSRYFGSYTGLEIKGLLTKTSEDAPWTYLTFSTGDWLDLPVPANGALWVEWVASTAPGVPRCSIPVVTHINYNWSTQCGQHERCYDAARVADTWGMIGAHVMGTFHREMSVTHAYATSVARNEDQDEDFHGVRAMPPIKAWHVFSRGRGTGDIGGLGLSGTPAFDCQGVF